MTQASDSRPTKRKVFTQAFGEMNIEIGERILVMRPVRTRRGGPAEIVVNYGLIYQRAMRDRVEEQRAMKKRTRRAR